MKKIIFIIFSVMLILTGCSLEKTDVDDAPEEYVEDTPSSITMKIKDGTLTSTSATIVINDNSQTKNTFAISFNLYKKENDKWIHLDFLVDDVITTLRNYFVDESNVLEMEQNWESLYGNLSSGEYKLVKYARDSKNNIIWFSTDFIID